MTTQDITNSAGTATGKLQCVAAGGWLPNGTLGNGQYGRNDTRASARKKIRLGAAAVSGLRLGFCGFYEKNATGETPIGNDYQVEAAIEFVSPSTYQRAYIDDRTVATVPNGAQLVLSTPINFDLPGDSDIYTRVSFTVPYGSMNLPGHQSQNARSGDSYEFSSGSTSQVAGTGNIVAPTGGINYLCCGMPYVVLGIPATPMPAVIILGDSIADGYRDGSPNSGGDGNGNSGFIQRGLWSVNGHAIPATRQTVGGNQLSFNQENTGPAKRTVWQYHTHLLCELSTNDIANGTALSTLQAQLTAIWQAAKRVIGPYGKPLNVTQSLCVPRTTSVQYVATATLGAGGSGYAASSTFPVTIAGGTLNGSASASTVSVTTNASGVVTSVGAITNNGGYAYNGTPAASNSPTGGSGSGLTLTLTFGGWTSAADQTPIAGFAVGGTRDLLNSWIKAQVGQGLLDAVIDPNQYVEDQANKGCWVTNGSYNYATYEGTHENPVGSVLAAQAPNAWAATLSV